MDEPADKAAVIFKIATANAWRDAGRTGWYLGSDADRRDGFIHLSAAHQVAETAAKHFAGETDLLLIAIDAARIGPGLKWEPSRGGDLFPHLYGPLSTSAALWTVALPLGQDGIPSVPKDLERC